MEDDSETIEIRPQKASAGGRVQSGFGLVNSGKEGHADVFAGMRSMGPTGKELACLHNYLFDDSPLSPM